MKWIVITSPGFVPGEAEYIDRLFEHGLDILHLRKPCSNVDDCARLLEEISPKWLSSIVVHDHFQLCERYGLRGIHLNRRNPVPPTALDGSVSRSCHSMEEIEKHMGTCDYMTLSPIFDSISKRGYASPFTRQQLVMARDRGLINSRVIALGGVTLREIPMVRQLGFGGVALLGDVWQRMNDRDADEYLEALRKATL